MTSAIATAHPNVALSKYWGKRPYGGNVPAVPSLSITLGGLTTRTRVLFDDSLDRDVLILNGEPALEDARLRAADLLDRVRAAADLSARAHVSSTNDFPTASGLASSASGFAALALAAAHAAGLGWTAERVSDLARRSSGSAARSLFGGFVELEAGPKAGTPELVLAARPLAGAERLPLVVLVCIATEAAKAIGSTRGMEATLARSPYASAWLDEAPRLHGRLREALLSGDFARVGELAEASTLAMHASAIAAGVVYWSAVTLRVLETVRGLRAAGIAAFASIDAGPHVKVLTAPGERERVRDALVQTSGVLRVIEAYPGPGASLESGSVQ